jgi:hypothetical protein
MAMEAWTMDREKQLRRRIRVALGIFLVGLVGSGLTAFPLLHEVEWLGRFVGLPEYTGVADAGDVRGWIATVREGLRETYAKYPFMAYGTDWLAFGHLVIALFFLGPLVEPESNRWIVVAGMIGCGFVVVTALICGAIRGIPVWWRLIDCSFGIFGFIPLWWCARAQSDLVRIKSRIEVRR